MATQYLRPVREHPALITLFLLTLPTGYGRPTSPPSDHSSPNDPPEFVSRPRNLSDDDDDENYGQQSQGYLPRKGGYESRIQQILYENPDLLIEIKSAGKNHESGGSFIVYTIKTGVCAGIHAVTINTR